MVSRSRLAAAALSLTLVAGACGAASKSANVGPNPNAPEVNPAGDIPDNQVFVAYSPPSGGFTVSVPEGWARTDAGGVVTFTDKLNSVRMETIDTATQPTVESARTNDAPAIQAAAKGYEAGKVSFVNRKSGAAILITYRADATPDPTTGKVVRDDVERYEFFKDGKQVILTLSGPQGADNVDPWMTVTDSFTWK